MKSFDLVVIGAGSGGLTAATYAKKLGASVAMIEKRDVLGGECLQNGCVPSKTLIHASKRYYQSDSSSKFGVNGKPTLDFEDLNKSIVRAIRRIEDRDENDEHFEKLGVKVFHGEAKFIDGNTVEVNGEKVHGRRFIIATGSRPRVVDVPGQEHLDVYSNETIFNIKKKPESMAILGGGVIGCEIGCAYNFLETNITIFERYDHLSLRVDPEIAKFVTSKFTERGIDVVTNSNLEKITKKKGDKLATLHYKKGKQSLTSKADSLFMAIGRIPNTDLDLENAGVEYTSRGITINGYGQTSRKNIWAVGDVTGMAGFTHVAGEQAYYAVVHAMFGLRHKVSLHALPFVIFTRPEVAHVGKTEKDLKAEGIPHVVRAMDYSEIDRAMIEDKPGMIKVMLDKRDRILGATVAGSQATEQIGTFVLAMSNRLTMRDIAKTILPYPTYAMAPKTLAANHITEKVINNKLGEHAMRIFRQLRR